MAYESTNGLPVIMGSNSDGGLLGGGGIGALLIGALLFGGGLGGFGGNKWGAGAPATTAVATDIVLNPAFQSVQNQITNLSDSINQNQLTGQIELQSVNFSDALRDLSDQLGSAATAIAAANFTTLQSINGLGTTIQASQNQNALQTLNSFNLINTNLLQGVNQINSNIAGGFAAQVQQLNDISRSMDDCCCEIKSVINSDGDATRALINSLNVASLTQQLSDAKTQVTVQSQTNAIIAALAPRCGGSDRIV